jgi:hypothetical protein
LVGKDNIALVGTIPAGRGLAAMRGSRYRPPLRRRIKHRRHFAIARITDRDRLTQFVERILMRWYRLAWADEHRKSNV